MDADYRLLVSCGLRTWSQQAVDYAVGRDENEKVIGKTITDAPPGYSWHQYGLAVDIAIEDAHNVADWNDTHPVWIDMVAKGQSLGMVSGDCWHLKDGPHWQMTGSFGVRPNAEVINLLTTGGTIAVWKAAFPDYSPSLDGTYSAT